MNESDIYKHLTEIVEDALFAEGVKLLPSTRACDIPGWDSMANLNIMLAAERYFHIKFRVDEIERMEKVADLVEAIESKLEKQV